MSQQPIQFAIDGKWVAGLPAEDFGFLGDRYLCVLGQTPGQPSKKLLLRLSTWPQASAPPGGGVPALALAPIPDGERHGLRPALQKSYHMTGALSEGKFDVVPCAVMQQDITGLVSLRRAVLRALKEGHPELIWQLFYNACQALDRYNKAADRRLVRLQSPMSLAVDADLRVVPLDAEMQVDATQATEAQRVYGGWFGEKYRDGLADQGEASLLHANALLLYFRRLLNGLQQKEGDGDGAAIVALLRRVGEFPENVTLRQLEESIREAAEDWSLPLALVLLGLPFYQQDNDHSCGFIAVLTVVRYFFPTVDPAQVQAVVGDTAQDGCDQARVLDALRAFDIRAHIQEDIGRDDLFDLALHGKPVIVTVWHDDWECDHWTVVRGIDCSNNRIHLINYNDSAIKGIPWDEFVSVWEPVNYGLICEAISRS